jgi:hypothetical protein
VPRGELRQGRVTQGEWPEWGPLLRLVGEPLIGDFMWMFEVELSDGTAVQAYKHIRTRAYIHLDAEGAAYVYESSGEYRPAPAAKLLAEACRGRCRFADG